MWKSVSKPPKIKEGSIKCLTFNPNRAMKVQQNYYYISKSKSFNGDGFWGVGCPTHWMPYPKEPEFDYPIPRLNKLLPVEPFRNDDEILDSYFEEIIEFECPNCGELLHEIK